MLFLQPTAVLNSPPSHWCLLAGAAVPLEIPSASWAASPSTSCACKRVTGNSAGSDSNPMWQDTHAENISLATEMHQALTVSGTQALRISQPVIRQRWKKGVQKDASNCSGRAASQCKQSLLSGHILSCSQKRLPFTGKCFMLSLTKQMC